MQKTDWQIIREFDGEHRIELDPVIRALRIEVAFAKKPILEATLQVMKRNPQPHVWWRRYLITNAGIELKDLMILWCPRQGVGPSRPKARTLRNLGKRLRRLGFLVHHSEYQSIRSFCNWWGLDESQAGYIIEGVEAINVTSRAAQSV